RSLVPGLPARDVMAMTFQYLTFERTGQTTEGLDVALMYAIEGPDNIDWSQVRADGIGMWRLPDLPDDYGDFDLPID
ncbi:MAG: hypothetical protein O3B04_10500, partial [Chloroflexi bacterium]|nr:hypothetical protein [Chloroflexota bacterium]